MHPITVTLTFNTVAEAAAFFQGQGHAAAAEAPVKQVTKAAAEKPASTKPAPESKAADTKTEDAPVIERATVSQAAVKLAVKNKDRAVAILAEHGVKAVKELPDDQLAAVHAKLVAAMDA